MNFHQKRVVLSATIEYDYNTRNFKTGYLKRGKYNQERRGIYNGERSVGDRVEEIGLCRNPLKQRIFISLN